MVKTQSLHSLIYCPALYPVYDEVIIIISGGGGVLLRHVRHHPADSSPQPGFFCREGGGRVCIRTASSCVGGLQHRFRPASQTRRDTPIPTNLPNRKKDEVNEITLQYQEKVLPLHTLPRLPPSEWRHGEGHDGGSTYTHKHTNEKNHTT